MASGTFLHPAQVALSWLMAQGQDIVPIPGTKRVTRVEENTASVDVELTADHSDRLGRLAPAVGDRLHAARMRLVDR